eukprot:3033442-Amphidinium_carterae.1
MAQTDLAAVDAALKNLKWQPGLARREADWELIQATETREQRQLQRIMIGLGLIGGIAAILLSVMWNAQ